MKYFSEFIQKLIRSSTHKYQPIAGKNAKITKGRNSWSMFQNLFKR